MHLWVNNNIISLLLPQTNALSHVAFYIHHHDDPLSLKHRKQRINDVLIMSDRHSCIIVNLNFITSLVRSTFLVADKPHYSPFAILHRKCTSKGHHECLIGTKLTWGEGFTNHVIEDTC